MLSKEKSIEVAQEIRKRLSQARDMTEQDLDLLVANIVREANKEHDANSVFRIQESVGMGSFLRDPPFASYDEAYQAFQDTKVYIRDVRRSYKIMKITTEEIESWPKS